MNKKDDKLTDIVAIRLCSIVTQIDMLTLTLTDLVNTSRDTLTTLSKQLNELIKVITNNNNKTDPKFLSLVDYEELARFANRYDNFGPLINYLSEKLEEESKSLVQLLDKQESEKNNLKIKDNGEVEEIIK